MATKLAYKTTFEVDQVIRPIYTGGSVALDSGSRILATTLGEDAVLTDLATGRLFARIEGDGEPISTLILTPSASHLVVCSRSLAMRIYALQVSQDLDAVEPTLLRTLKPHATPAVVLAVDRTSTLLATGAADGNIKVWDIRGGFVTHTFRGPSVLVSALHFFEVAATAGGAAAEVAARDGKKKKNKKGTQQQSLPASTAQAVDTAARFRLASGSQDGKVRVWDLHKRAVVANLDAHVSDVQALDYSPVQNVFVTAGRDKTIIWWDAKTWTQRRVVPTFELIEAAGFVSDADGADGADAEADSGAVTYSAGANGCIRLWETRTGREITAEQPARSDEELIVAALFRPAQSTLLCVQMDQTLALYPVPSSRDLLSTFASNAKAGGDNSGLAPLEPARRISGTHDDVIDLAFLLPDQSLLALGTNSEDVRIVSVAEPAASSTPSSAAYFGQDVALLKGHTDIVVSLDVDWSGHWVATGAKDNTARLWRIDQSATAAGGNKVYSCYAVFAGHAESVGAVALPKAVPEAGTPAFEDALNHPPAFLVTGSQDLTVKRWDIPRQAPTASSAQQRALFTRKAHDKDINALDVDAAGQLFASSSQDRTVKIFSVREGEVQGILRGHRRGVWSVKFAPLHTPSLTSDTGTVAGGSRGFVLTGSGDKTVKLWSLADYTCLRTFEGHTNSVLKVAWLGSGGDGAEDDGNDNDGGGEADDEYMDLDDDEERPSRRSASSFRGPAPVLFASAGGDGLVKVWDAASGEAACTLDNHEDRVWALAVRNPAPAPTTSTRTTTTTTTATSSKKRRTRMFVSGGGDATISFWRDTTASTVAAAAEAAKERVEQEQLLANHMRRGAYREALTLALQLNQPGRLLSVLSQVGEYGANPGVDAALASLTDDQLYLLLLRVRDWNTNGRTATVAQRVLASIVRSYPATRLAGLARRRHSKAAVEGGEPVVDDMSAGGVSSSIRGANIKDVLDALLAYTERHYRRMAELLDESYLVDYTLQEMDALQMPGGPVAGEIEDVAMAGAE
ncbi:U3 small nucleolar RNA-associated protein 13 [Sporothrix brasiliensis 5110]|uniref:U3 small nucleolar RNA-associated protein 13 n=1 Tax=Sporothrix brasiliensis 5110 TaxID=1398154 RepID=A0A0C2IN06_9PEZI|nr:U3 small nucleolar RNA-associated protein 13 [Sporothrix brasiliensis 5110]KIH88390.1 U3 small nucleolar RNA-associated protein 13 [Sporothrix brasiliensis 5110]